MKNLVYLGVLTALLGSVQAYASDASVLADVAEERNIAASITHTPITPIIPSDPQTTAGATAFLQTEQNTLSNEGVLAIGRSEHLSTRTLREEQSPSIDLSLLQDVRNIKQLRFLAASTDLIAAHQYYNSLNESLFTRTFKMALRTGAAFGIFSLLDRLKG